MKKAVVAAMVLGAVLAGCSPFALNIRGYIYREESLDSAWRKVASQEYIRDFGEYWASPMEFESRGGGDCEDFAIALVYRLGKSAKSVCVRLPSGDFHEIVKYDGRYLEPQKFGMYYDKEDLTILWEISYDATMLASTLWGAKTLGEDRPAEQPAERDTCSHAFAG